MAERPLGITIISIYNIIGGIAGLIVVGLLFTYTSFPSEIKYLLSLADESLTALVGIALVLLTIGIIFTVAQLVVAYGLLKGFSWAWWLQFIITIFMGVSGLLGSFIQFIIAIVILYYITRPHVKAYFGVQ